MMERPATAERRPSTLGFAERSPSHRCPTGEPNELPSPPPSPSTYIRSLRPRHRTIARTVACACEAHQTGPYHRSSISLDSDDDVGAPTDEDGILTLEAGWTTPGPTRHPQTASSPSRTDAFRDPPVRGAPRDFRHRRSRWSSFRRRLQGRARVKPMNIGVIDAITVKEEGSYQIARGSTPAPKQARY